MAWTNTLVERLRYYINDINIDSYAWTDLQLQKFIAIATISVSEQLKQWPIGYTYVVDTSVPSITPDPTTAAGVPPGFNNLIVIYAGWVVAHGEMKKKSATAGFKITDDKSTIDTTSVMGAFKDTADSYMKNYKDAVYDFQMGNKFAGAAILSPYSAKDGGPVTWWPDDRSHR